MRIRELKKGREELDQEVLLRGRITNIRIYPDYALTPNKYRVELDGGEVLELAHFDIFGVLEKEETNANTSR